MISVVIPAHDEERRIVECLRSLQEGAPEGAMEIAVVANGCTDATAQAARGVEGPIRVLELEDASKIAALNAGDAILRAFPRVYLDGDIEITWRDVERLLAALQDTDVELVAPERRWKTNQSPWIVRSYTEFAEHLPTVERSVTGCGVLVVTREGRARFDAFPDVIADDAFLEAHFRPSERRSVPGAVSVVEAPRTLKGLVHRRTRVQRGNRQLRELGLIDEGLSAPALLSVIAKRPRLVLHLPAFLLVSVAARIRVWRSPRSTWERAE